MTTKSYTGKSGKSNAKRAAVAALGKTAKLDVDFKITEADGGFSWVVIGDGKTKRAKRGKADIRNQPQAIKVLKMCERVSGATPAQIAEALDVEEHTGRSIVSRLRSAGCKINKRPPYFHVAAE